MIKKILLGLILFVLVGVGTLVWFIGDKQRVFDFVTNNFAPAYEYDAEMERPAPSYNNPNFWAALPNKDDEADFYPNNSPLTNQQKTANADVFYIHPTGYINGRSTWNSAINLLSETTNNTKWMLANQASAFNSCCRVFAPHYREASIFAFFVKDKQPENFEKALALAYSDVEKAFQYFIENHSDERPFIIASHSQGTFHAIKLIQNKIDGTKLAKQMVAGYLIGGELKTQQVEALKDISACQGNDDINCIVHWASFGPNFDQDDSPFKAENTADLLCTNPLSWRINEKFVDAEENLGAVATTGEFDISFWNGEQAPEATLQALGPIYEEFTSAQCKQGKLVVQDLSQTIFKKVLLGENYHGIDYSLFHQNIRHNALERVKRYKTIAFANERRMEEQAKGQRKEKRERF